ALEKFVSEEQCHFGEKRVGHDDHDGREHSGLRCGTAYSLRATAHGQTFVTANRRQDKGEEKRLHKSLHQVRKIQSVDGTAPELDGAKAQRKNGSYAAAQESHKIGHCG